ncbi:MAG TPA: sulfite exporter TauE/SafE family protein [Thermoanaerobaculia bacterium]|nr:sulfite exporter TauE/SafE family protein [Thermoanaerobaculia bacterium]
MNVHRTPLVWTLIGALAASAVFFLIRWVREARRISSERGAAPPGPTPLLLAVGLVTNFFDTLGIGSIATTTAIFRLFRLVPDELIPGTIIVGDLLAVMAQAALFIGVVEVDPVQLTALILACVAGGWLGTGVVTRLSRRAMQLGLGTALLVAVLFMAVGMFGLNPAGGTARALTPAAFALALAVNFVLGALLPLGIGNYAPSLVVFGLLGLDLKAAFPIMMGSGAFAATVAGVRFLSTRRFQQQAALGLVLGGIPGVIVAVWLVKSLPLGALRVVVLAVVLYAAVTLLRAGMSRRAV